MKASAHQPVDSSSWFSSKEFAARRDRVFAEIGPAIAIVQGAGPGRGFEVFRQTNEFFYLCGHQAPGCLLVLDGAARRTTLYLPEGNAHAYAEVERLGPSDADALTARTGVDAVAHIEDAAKTLAAATEIYTPHAPAESSGQARDSLVHAAKYAASDPWDGSPTREERFITHLRNAAPVAQIRDLTPILDDLRGVKSPRELDAMRGAGRLSAQAVKGAMQATKYADNERQLLAIAEYVFASGGARGTGYAPIIPCGPNIWYGHYCGNDQPLLPGELILMDCAPEFCYYTSDIGRMFPVNGKYSPVQRELYGFMVEYHKRILGLIKPGAMPVDILAAAAAQMEPIVESTPWSKDIYREAARRTLTFRGHLSHPVGLAVHDVGKYFEKPLPVGLVITIDPQMWIPEERLYIRVEDTVAVVEGGVEVLTREAPLELDDVEATMSDDGPFAKELLTIG